jgi:hypothetical protein
MKKLFLFVAATAVFAACSETEVLDQAVVNQQAIENDGAVKFDVYAQRGLTRGGGYSGDITNKTIAGKDKGFGVFAFYTDNEKYSSTARPNFMYNQKVWFEGDSATFGTLWKYEPVKYWPNEYGNAAISDAIDYVTFFAYAPWTEVAPTTGKIVVPDSIVSADSIQKWQTKNIISVNSNTTQGDPIVKYVVDTDPGTSVDLLWGVAAQQADSLYTAIDGKEGTEKANADVEITPGLPFIDLVKPNNPVSDRLVFNLKHALAKVKVTIDYIADQPTPLNGTFDKDTYGLGKDINGNDSVPSPVSEIIDSLKTRIFVRSFSIDGWATEGALNLNNTEPGVPLWKDIDGSKDLSFNTVTFFDGLKDNKEGTANNIQKSETPTGLNPTIIENYALTDTMTAQAAETAGYGKDSIIFRAGGKNHGVPSYQEGSVLLFGGDDTANGGYFYVIPRNADEDVNVKIVYDVQTIDQNLAGLLSDGVTHGSNIENVISKEAIFGQGVDFEPGYQYWIKIHIGMTSVKIEATVEPWIDNGQTTVNLPDNQNPDINIPGSVIPEAGKYKFTSTFEGGTATGEAEIANDPKIIGGYVEITVVNNSVPGWDNKKFFIPANAKVGDTVDLLTYDETTGKFTKVQGIKVKIDSKI